MCEQPTIVIMSFAAREQNNVAAADQAFELGARRLREWLVGSAVLADLRGIHTD